MTATPTGRTPAGRTPTGRLSDRHPLTLEISREFAVPPDELWAEVTESSRTAAWIGPWSGDPASGTIAIRLNAEEGAPEQSADITACDPPHLLRLRIDAGGQAWLLTVEVAAAPGGSRVTLLHHLDDPATAEFSGPGWEFYLDRLAAVITDAEDPAEIDFEPDYLPGMAAHYRALVAAT